jgi:hypothetical protein
MNTFLSSSYRNDEQLYVALCETGEWTINGRGGQVLGVAPSLRLAVDRAEDYAEGGATVIALCRLTDNIIVFAEQVDRLRLLIEEREANPVRHTWLAATW